MDELITLSEAARRLALSVPAVRRLVRVGKLRACRPGDGGRAVRLFSEDVERHIRDHTTAGDIGTNLEPRWVKIRGE